MITVAVIVTSSQKALRHLFQQEERDNANDNDEIVQRLLRVMRMCMPVVGMLACMPMRMIVCMIVSMRMAMVMMMFMSVLISMVVPISMMIVST